MNQSLRLAKLWTALAEVKERLDNVAIPLGIHLGLEDPELMIAMEELSAQIEAHFEEFRLVATADRKR